MTHQVCTIAPGRAKLERLLAPFLPTAPDHLAACSCGEPLTLEMEKDGGRCVDCAFQAAMGAWEGPR